MIEIVQDTCGRHDTFGLACTARYYEDLGYPNAYFNDRMIDVINHLIATPEVNDPIILHRPHVLYEFIHPELEALSSGQKILIRLGSRNSIKVKQFLIEFKALIS